MKNRIIRLFMAVLFISGGMAFEGNAGKPKPKKKDDMVIIHTRLGDMKVLLYEETPLHKENFLRLARSGAYDSTIWHRVIEEFMIQGGDVTKKSGETYKDLDNIPAEFIDSFYHTKGALAAARTGDNVNPEKKSSSCQFYIVQGRKFEREELEVDQGKLQRGVSMLLARAEYDTLRQQFQDLSRNRDNEGINNLALSLVDLCEQELGIRIRKEVSEEALQLYVEEGGAPHLDGEYTVYGRVVEGLEVIDKIAAVEKNGSTPMKDIYMTMEVITLKTKEITKLYGYVYPPVSKK